jgi:hypothetical protein
MKRHVLIFMLDLTVVRMSGFVWLFMSLWANDPSHHVNV